MFETPNKLHDLSMVRVSSHQFVSVRSIARCDMEVGEWDNFGEHVRLWLTDGTLIRVFGEKFIGNVWRFIELAFSEPQ